MKLSDIRAEQQPGETLHQTIDRVFARTPNGIVYLQEKLDGINLTIHPDGRIITRRGKVYANDFFPSSFYVELHTLRRLFRSVRIHAEAFSVGKKLYDSAGDLQVTRTKYGGDTKHLRVVVFDADHPANVTKFSNRNSIIAHMSMWLCDNYHFQFEIARPFQSTAELLANYNALISTGAEGVVLRRDPCYIPADDDDSPHPDAWKLKNLFTAEGTCFDWEPGRGKRKGMLGALWLRLGPEFGGVAVRVGGGNGLDNKMLTKLAQRPPIGLSVTFSYQDRHESGTPLRPQFVAIRNYE